MRVFKLPRDIRKQICRCFEQSFAQVTLSYSIMQAKLRCRLPSDKSLAVNLICSVDLVAAGRAAHELFMWLSHRDTIPRELIRDDHLVPKVSKQRPAGRASVKNEVASAEHRAKAIQQKLDRLDDAFIYKESIDLGTYERQRDRLREELTLVEIDRHGSYRRRWSNGSGFNDCFFRKEWRSAEKHSIEPS